MELTFEVRIIVGYNLQNWDRQCFAFDYEPSTQDYEEFARYCGFNNALEILTCDLNEEEDKEEIEEIKQTLENDNCYSLYFYLDKHSMRLFEDFLVKKYQEKVERWLLNNLTHNSDKDLNDIINYG